MASRFFPKLATIEVNYTIEHTTKLLYDSLWIPPLASVAYVLLVFSGKRWMKDRSPFDLRRLLTAWNSVLAAFSIVGFLVMFPPIVELVLAKGYVYAVCNTYITERPWLSFWGLVFVYSKLFEFGDTLFIVLRKTPLNFLHWYHHMTVLMYSWYGLATWNTAGHWFAAINFGVHGFMYSYYMLKSMGFRILPSVAKAITILQLTQFVVGLGLVFTGLWMRWLGLACGMNDVHIRAGLIMYGSYFILFLNFFYKRYINPPSKAGKKD